MSDENLYSAPDAEIDISQHDELAGRGARLVAVLIDSLLLGAISFAIFAFTGMLETIATQPGTSTSVLSAALGMVVFLGINGYLLAKRGQTVGKSLLGIRIVSHTTGELLPLPRLLGLRYLPVWLVTAIPIVGPLLGLVNALFIFRSDRRCVHDLIAGTHVVRA